MLGRRGQGKEAALWLPPSLEPPGAAGAFGWERLWPGAASALLGAGQRTPRAFGVTALGNHQSAGAAGELCAGKQQGNLSPRSAFLGSPQSPGSRG